MIKGIKHEVIPAGQIPESVSSEWKRLKEWHEDDKGTKHPMGTVHSDGKHGYVANGYDWLKFDLKELDKFKPVKKDIQQKLKKPVNRGKALIKPHDGKFALYDETDHGLELGFLTEEAAKEFAVKNGYELFTPKTKTMNNVFLGFNGDKLEWIAYGEEEHNKQKEIPGGAVIEITVDKNTYDNRLVTPETANKYIEEDKAAKKENGGTVIPKGGLELMVVPPSVETFEGGGLLIHLFE